MFIQGLAHGMQVLRKGVLAIDNDMKALNYADMLPVHMDKKKKEINAQLRATLEDRHNDEY